MQQVAANGLCYALAHGADSWMRFLKGEQVLLGFPFHRRSDELHTHKDVVPKGARWTDHYGKRSHDIDVEHMR
jgi:hypothetical protein